MSLTAAGLAAKLGLPCEGDGTAPIRRAAALRDAGAGDVTFIASPRYAALAARAPASALVAAPDFKGPFAAKAVIRAPNPEAVFIPISVMLAPPPPPAPPPGADSRAAVSPDAVLGEGVSVGPFSVIEAGARIGAGTVIGPQCYIGHGVTIGQACRLYAQVCIREHVRVGDRAILHHGVVLGSDGFGYYPDAQGRWNKIPQVGVVEIGNDVEIGANTTVDRARFGVTRLGDGVKLDNLIQVGHNVEIGAHTAVAAQCGFAGSAILGRHVRVAGQVGVAGHLEVGDGAVLGGKSVVLKDVPAGQYVSGNPAMPHQENMRRQGELGRIRALREQVKAMEARLCALEPGKDAP